MTETRRPWVAGLPGRGQLRCVSQSLNAPYAAPDTGDSEITHQAVARWLRCPRRQAVDYESRIVGNGSNKSETLSDMQFATLIFCVAVSMTRFGTASALVIRRAAVASPAAQD